MTNSKMYKLELFTTYCVDFYNITSRNDVDEILSICTKSRYIKNVDEMDYVRCACAISYEEMLDYIKYYDEHITDESSFVNFICTISEKHNVPVRVVNKRFNDVYKLSNSLYKNKLKKRCIVDANKKIK